MQFKKSIPLIAILGIASSTGLAQIYKTVDANGNVSYSDNPSKHAKIIDIGPINTTPSNTNSKRPKNIEHPNSNRPPETENTTGQSYRNVKITSPTPDSIISNGLNGLNVSVASSPALIGEDQFKLFIDGIPRGLSSSNSFSLDRINRGEHTLTVKIVNSSNKVIKSSNSVKIFVRWPQPKR